MKMSTPQGMRIFNTWVGDPAKLLLLGKVVEIIKRDHLLEKNREVGKHFQSELSKLAVSLSSYDRMMS